MPEIDPDFADILPPAPDTVDPAAIAPDETPAGAQDAAPSGEPEASVDSDAAPDTVEALLEKLEAEDPDTAAALLEAIEGKAAQVEEPAKVQAVPGQPVIADEDRVMIERAEINDIAANLETTSGVYQQNWNAAYANYQGAVGRLNQYIAKCQEREEAPDADVVSMHQEYIAGKLTENNKIAQEAVTARENKQTINDSQKEMANYPAFAKFPRLYAAMRLQKVFDNTMPIQQRLTLLMDEAKRQGITAGEQRDPKKIDRLRKAASRLKMGKAAGGTATRKAISSPANESKDLPAHLRARAEHMLARL